MNDIEALSQKKCAPCEGGTLPLSAAAVRKHLIGPLKEWRLVARHRVLTTDYRMRDFRAAVELLNRIAALAEEEQHHPDLSITAYRRLSVRLSTHAIGGLSENDLIMAAKITALPKALKI